MKLKILAFVLLVSSFGFASGGTNIPASYITACGSGVATCPDYLGAAPTVGQTVAVWAWWAGQSLTATVTDGANTYTSIAGPTNVGSVMRFQVWYATVSTAETTITVNLSGNATTGASDGILVGVLALTGLATSSQLDTATVATATGTGTAMSVTSGTPTNANDMMLTIFMTPTYDTPWSGWGSGWSEILINGCPGACAQEAASDPQYINITTATPKTAIVTGGSSQAWGGVVMGFKPSGTGCDGSGNCYVYPSATGTGTGASWTNAYTGFGTSAGQVNPTSMTRGVTYWLGAGSYGSPTFSTPDSGTAVVSVLSATVANHGPDGTWSNAYAGQAVFGPTGITTDYWNFSGQTRTTMTSGYNLKFWNQTNGSANALGNQGSGTYTNWNISYAEIEGTNTVGSTYSDEGFSCYPTCNNIYLGYNWIHNVGADNISSNPPSSPGSGWIIEQNWISYNHSGMNSTHSQGAQLTVSNLTFRYNVMQDIISSAFISDASSGSPSKSVWDVYGNVFFWDAAFAAGAGNTVGVGDGIIGDFNTTPSGSVFYNNTIYGLTNTGSAGYCSSNVWYTQPTDSITENNVWEQTTNCNPTDSSSIGTLNYETYGKNSSNSSDSSSQKQTTTGELFSNPTASTIAGFALLANTSAGATLSSPYTTDLLGITRGSNGTWDRGAFQLSTNGVGGSFVKEAVRCFTQ